MPTDFHGAQDRYWRARWQAVREDWMARLMRKPENLLPYQAVAEVLKSFQHRQITELRSIPLDRIIGSVERYRDFTRGFLPRDSVALSRWMRIDVAIHSPLGVPPIEVYQIGEVYFVSDGNHRVSVARANGFKEIDAYVTLVPGVALQPGDTLEKAIIKSEGAHFLAQTRLAEQGEDLDIHFTQTGGYPRLLEHIYTHLYFMKLDRAMKNLPPDESLRFPQAARDWYDNVYLPIVAAVRKYGLLDRYPDRTVSDLYVWVSARILELVEQYGYAASPEAAAQMLVDEAPTPFYRTVKSLIDRLSEIAQRFSSAHSS